VRDEKHRQAKFFAQAAEQLKDLRLDSYIKSGGGFVSNQEFRPVYDGHRDHHSLPHSA
jgi:hypothetical protein